MLKIAVMVSGGGTNLQAIIDAHKQGKLPGVTIDCVVSNKPDAYALKRAEENGITGVCIRPKDYAISTTSSRHTVCRLKHLKGGNPRLSFFSFPITTLLKTDIT